MLEQNVYYRLGSDVSIRVEPERLEVFVFADQFRRLDWEQLEKPFQIRAGQRRF